jgi:hypothetical protein
MQSPKRVVFNNNFSELLTLSLVHAVVGNVDMSQQAFVDGFSNLLAKLSIPPLAKEVKATIEKDQSLIVLESISNGNSSFALDLVPSYSECLQVVVDRNEVSKGACPSVLDVVL